MMTRETAIEIGRALKHADNEMVRIIDAQTGRDTHPLWSDEASPLDLHVASHVEIIRSHIAGLRDCLMNYTLWLDDEEA